MRQYFTSGNGSDFRGESSLALTILFAVLACCGLFFSSGASASDSFNYIHQELDLGHSVQRVRLPSGYKLELLTDNLSGPRLMTFARNGDLLIGSKSGKVYRLPPPYRSPEVLLDLGGYPHSVAVRDHELWIAETGGLYRAPYTPGQKQVDAATVKLVARLPTGGHSSRTVAVGPDHKIYVSLGISGNCSNQYLDDSYPFERRRGGMFVLKKGKDGDRLVPYASGFRNPVGFDWNPVSHVMYASNNGPDHLGFDQPPEYFSKVLPGSFHGMPWFQFDGKRIHRDTCIRQAPPRPITDVPKPVATFPARNAPMGVVFVPRGALKPGLAGDAIVALHGSWGTRPSGGAFGSRASRRPPKLVIVRFKKGKSVRVDDLVTGFQLRNGDRWARPVGVAIGPDGALYFTSDSDTNALFRLRANK